MRSNDRYSLDQRVIDAVRQILGMAPLYSRRSPTTMAQRLILLNGLTDGNFRRGTTSGHREPLR